MQIPKIGSNVIVVFYSPTVAFVVMVDEVDEILINGGENGGLVNVEDLKSWMSNVESDLSTLKNITKYFCCCWKWSSFRNCI